MYVSRVWDPDAVDVEDENVRNERMELNEFRADVVREGRRVLGNRFVGGLQRTDHAELRYRDCICDGPAATNRWRYLKIMRESSVGIASAGLHGNAGSKLSEYVAASRGVVTTKLPMSLPGDFATGVNYDEVATPARMIETCAALIEDPDRLSAMMMANRRYYEEYVRPSSCVMRTIQQALALPSYV